MHNADDIKDALKLVEDFREICVKRITDYLIQTYQIEKESAVSTLVNCTNHEVEICYNSETGRGEIEYKYGWDSWDLTTVLFDLDTLMRPNEEWKLMLQKKVDDLTEKKNAEAERRRLQKRADEDESKESRRKMYEELKAEFGNKS